MTRRPTTSISATKTATLASVSASAMSDVLDRERGRGRRRIVGRGVQERADRRQQHQRQHHRDVLDDEPADGDAAALGLHEAPLLQRPQQHHGARHRQRQAEDEPAAGRPAEPQASPQPSSVATAICASAPGMAMARTESRSFSEKCMPTPNISRMTPISASSVASPGSATKPGVAGPMTTPATR